MDKKKTKQAVFIRPKTAWKKLVTAQEVAQTIYICGVTGYGKTELVKNYLKTREYTYYTCRNGRLQQLEQKDRKNKKKNKVVDGEGMTLQTIVIDDLQFLREIEDREQILSMIRDEAYWVILISRSSLLPWLKTIYMNEGMMQITEEELIWRCQDVATYWQKHNEETLSEAQVNEIHDFSKGNPLSIRSIAKLSLDHGGYDPEYLKQSWCDFEDYLIEQLMREWDINLINFLMHMSFLDEIKISLAEMVTGNSASYQLLQEALYIGNFIIIEENECYRIRPLLRSALQKRARNTYDSEKIREIYYNAGLYYEMQDDIPNALTMYENCDSKSRIVEILIRNAKCNPGNGNYFKLRKYYFLLPEEVIEKNSILISGMSMLYSLLLQPENSEKWYNKLKELEKDLVGAARREAKSWIAYLDIALPHRGIEGIIDIIKSVPSMLFDKGISLSELSVTVTNITILDCRLNLNHKGCKIYTNLVLLCYL